MYDYSYPNGNYNMNNYGGYPAMGYPPNMQAGYYPQPQPMYQQQPVYQAQPMYYQPQMAYDAYGNPVQPQQPMMAQQAPNPYLTAGMNPDMGMQPVYDIYGNQVPVAQQQLIQQVWGYPINNDRMLNKDEQTYLSDRMSEAIDDMVSRNDTNGQYKTMEDMMEDTSKLKAKYTTMMPPTLGTNIILTDANGNEKRISLDGRNHYSPGMYSTEKENGTVNNQNCRYYQGGYNPATGMIAQPGAVNMAAPNQFNPYYNPYVQNRPMGYPMTLQDKELEQYLYDTADVSVMDLREELSRIVLTEEEQAISRSKRNMIAGYDYYGNPILNNRSVYESNMATQKAIQDRRKYIQDFYTQLSRVAHSYFGEEIIEENVRARFDPLPPDQSAKSYWEMTDKEKEKYREKQEEENMFWAWRKFEQDRWKIPAGMSWNEYREFIIDSRWAKIKESHDKLLGLEPGEKCDLTRYSEKSYKLMEDIKRKESFMKRVDGKKKFNENKFIAGLANKGNKSIRVIDGINANTNLMHAVQMETKDGTYKSIDEIDASDLCPTFEEFILSKQKAAESVKEEKTSRGQGTIYMSPQGTLTQYVDTSTIPISSQDKEDQMDYEFYKYAQNKEDLNNATRGLPATSDDERLDDKFKDYLDKKRGGQT